MSQRTVVRTRRRFLEQGLEVALHDKKPPGHMPKVTRDVEAHLTALACSDPPEGHARWTLQLLADQLVALGYIDCISSIPVCKRLRKIGLSLGAPNSRPLKPVSS